MYTFHEVLDYVDLMSLNLKNKNLDIATDLNSADKEIKYKKNLQRPNIDNLVKKIMIERNREKRNNIIMISIALMILVMMSLYFTQA